MGRLDWRLSEGSLIVRVALFCTVVATDVDRLFAILLHGTGGYIMELRVCTNYFICNYFPTYFMKTYFFYNQMASLW